MRKIKNPDRPMINWNKGKECQNNGYQPENLKKQFEVQGKFWQVWHGLIRLGLLILSR